LLIHGSAGLGKSRLVQAMLSFLWCVEPNAGLACGTCRHCHWMKERIHPDCRWLKPEAPGKAIKIDMLRESCAWLQLSPLNTRQKVLVIQSAEQLNAAASNALLKTLEEPQDSSLIILISAMPEHLLATLRSRCYKLSLPMPDESVARAWLQGQTDVTLPAVLPSGLGPYALLHAFSHEQNKIREQVMTILQELIQYKMHFLTAAEKLKEYAPQELLRYLYFSMEQQIRFCHTQNDLMELKHWLKFEQSWLEVKRSIVHGANLNWTLQLELLLARIPYEAR
jgi:DNA polymerase-3 subunit delta'